MIKNNRVGLSVIARSSIHTERQVFQMHPPKTFVKISDVHDAVQTTKKFTYNQKKHYFESLGIDLNRVERYLKPVLVLEMMFKDQSPRRVFQIQQINNAIIGDALSPEAINALLAQATKKLTYVKKREYFASLGMDIDRVEMYMKPVLVFEKLYSGTS